MKNKVNGHIENCKMLLNQKEYLLALEELRIAMEIIEKISNIDTEFPYEQKIKELIICRQSAMKGIIKEADID